MINNLLLSFQAQPEEPYRETSFASQAAFDAFVTKYRQESLVDAPVVEGHDLLTLSTCFNDDIRFVIMALEKTK